ncbi:MAG: DUF86 domain-containing protein [Candidatus Bipolaricaulota bacterium]
MVRPEVIRKRLQKLDEYLNILRGLSRNDEDAFLQNPEEYGSGERFLQLAIECTLDMGSHVIADEGLGVVNTYGDIPRILSESGLLDDSLRATWARKIGMRNVLVHEYLDIDRRIVYRAITEELEDLAQLRQVFARFL